MASYLLPKTDMIAVYDTHTGKEIGRIKIGEPVLIKRSDSVNHYFDFGAGEAFVARTQVNITSSSTPTTGSDYRATTLPSKNEYICTDVISKTIVYDYARVKPIGTLAPGYQFPLIGGDSQGWYAVKIGGRIGKVRVKDVRFSKGVPVLCYHRLFKSSEQINPTTNDAGSVEGFAGQLDYLKNNNYTVLTLQELELYLTKRLNIPVKSVVITFDDGNKTSVRNAYPELKKRGMRATEFFIATRIRDIATENWDPSSNQTMVLSEMKSVLDVFKFESHTFDMHRNPYPPVTGTTSQMRYSTEAQIIEDLRKAKDHLVKNGFAAPTYLAYPFGSRDAKVVNAVKRSGVVDMALTIDARKAMVGDDILQVPRYQIKRTHERNNNEAFKREVDVS